MTIPETILRRTPVGATGYIRVCVEPYVRKDGRVTRLVTWRTCCRCCGAMFTVTSPATKRAIRRGPQIVHCPEHRQPHAKRERT